MVVRNNKTYDRLIELQSKYQLLTGREKLSPHFALMEFRCKDSSKTLPAFVDFLNIHQTLIFLETVRLVSAEPVIINSAYRTLEYNQRIGGSKKSAHTTFHAADFFIESMIGDYEHVWRECDEIAKHLESIYGFFIRLGHYDENKFIHVDCDKSKFRKRWYK